MCEKHKERKRPNTCPDCKAELEQAEQVVDTITENKEDSNPDLEPQVSEQQHRMYDSKAIRVMIEAEILKAVSKVRSEMSDLMKISWEHLYIPYSTFSIELMYALEKDGWKYCDLIKNARQFGYFMDGDIFLLQRVVRKGNNPIPDFTKTGSVKRYLEKINGKAEI